MNKTENRQLPMISAEDLDASGSQIVDAEIKSGPIEMNDVYEQQADALKALNERQATGENR